MKILNIHAGTTDKDIIDFMKGKTKDNNINLIDEGSISIEIKEEEEEDKLEIENIKKSNEDNIKKKFPNIK